MVIGYIGQARVSLQREPRNGRPSPSNDDWSVDGSKALYPQSIVYHPHDKPLREAILIVYTLA